MKWVLHPVVTATESEKMDIMATDSGVHTATATENIQVISHIISRFRVVPNKQNTCCTDNKNFPGPPPPMSPFWGKNIRFRICNYPNIKNIFTVLLIFTLSVI